MDDERRTTTDAGHDKDRQKRHSAICLKRHSFCIDRLISLNDPDAVYLPTKMALREAAAEITGKVRAVENDYHDLCRSSTVDMRVICI